MLELLDNDGEAGAGFGFVEDTTGEVVGRGRGGKTTGETVLLSTVPLGVESEGEGGGQEGGDAA
jgi:hypothetical protein